MISVVNIKHYKGTYEYVGRPSICQNDYTCKYSKIAKFKVSTTSEAIEKYKESFDEKINSDPEFIKEILRLYEIHKNGHLILGCWCVPFSDCHAFVIKEYLEGLDDD